MAVTKSWELTQPAPLGRQPNPVPRERRKEMTWLLGASLLVAGGLALVLLAKTEDFADQRARLARGEILDLNTVTSQEQLLPFLQVFANAEQRGQAAETVWSYIGTHQPLPNVGALARLRAVPLSNLKPFLCVRTPREFLLACALWLGVYMAAFWIVHLVWRWRRFRGDPAILPALHLLTGVGLILAISLRDPLRDTLEFTKFAWGCAI